MKHFTLKGTLCLLLQIIFSVLAIILIFAGVVTSTERGIGPQIGSWILFILGIVFGYAAFNIRYWLRYWLGHTIRTK